MTVINTHFMLLGKESLVRYRSLRHTDLFFPAYLRLFRCSLTLLSLLSSKQEGLECINLNSSNFNHYTSSLF